MKKLLSGLMAVAIVGSSAASVVACGKGLDTSKITGEKIWLVTDTGKVDDKSFNQSGFDGGNYFINNIHNPNGTDKTIGKTEPDDLSDLQAAYENAKFDGAGTLILPGFHHALEGENKAARVMNGGTTILLDGDDGGQANQIGIMFRGDVSGFYAGLSSLIQLSNDATWTKKEVVMSTFGGVHNAGAVDNFMVGYLASIEVFNKIVGDEKLKEQFNVGENVTSAKRVSTQENGPATDQESTWFSGSFAAGDGKTLSESHINAGASIIMPVAGPQTKDTLDAIGDRKDVFVVGVDTDQVTSYGTEKFLTSAEKPLVDATVISLGHSKLYNGKEGVQDKTLAYAKDKGASFSTAGTDGKFSSYDMEAKKGETWEGKTLWMGGKASNGGKNKVTAETYNKVSEIITQAMLEETSIDLFAKIATDASAKNILSNATVKAYADKIIADLNKE
ncbi:basic membrane protein A [Spiroplasma chinense]|uniref:Basic membrane protein A n=1 Tax=Spiroplasma chinense TaxID=216932 RepID=A0A5B9Y3F5_9MOLU|nr:BMP family ABC transporter substrate-binding protein [Spiroplasma chinense]QEH61325.1 basic membrane protein A [Spiroplasma chinense]